MPAQNAVLELNHWSHSHPPLYPAATTNCSVLAPPTHPTTTRQCRHLIFSVETLFPVREFTPAPAVAPPRAS
uniref:Uncharacterized protein n=1 Tax=Arundo donax TaxID=35708 RepID=A0A0A9GXS0_ARUDO